MSKPERVTIFPNGNVAVWDENGQQVAELQDSFFNYKYIDRLAKAIANDGLEVENMGFNPSDLWLRVDHYRKYTKLAQSAPANDKGDSMIDNYIAELRAKVRRIK